MAKWEIMNENLLRALECPSCLEYMCVPIHICITGHSICHACWDNLSQCPLCTEDLSQSRNFTLEEISELVHYPCKNRFEGCDEYFTSNDLEDHYKVCRYRLYDCKLSPYACTFGGTIDQLEKHVYEKHPLYVAQGNFNVFVFRSNERALTTHVMTVYGEMFYIHRCLKDSNVCWAVRYLGNFEENKFYLFRLEVKTKNNKHRKLSITERCNDNSADYDTDMIREGYCAAIPISILDTYKNGDTLTYSIEIIKETNNAKFFNSP